MPTSRQELARAAVLAAVLVVFALRALDTAAVYTVTFDEPAHVAAGLERLQRATYALDPAHPPLGRALLALPLHAAGVVLPDFPPGANSIEVGRALLSERTAEGPAVRSARAVATVAGVVLLAALFGVACARLGTLAGAAAALLASAMPGVVAHASLATTDLVGAAGLLFALEAWRRLLEQGGLARGALLGAGLAAAVLTKFSAIPFLALAAPAVAAVLLGPREASRRIILRWKEIALAGAVLAGAATLAYGDPMGLPRGVAVLARYAGEQGTAYLAGALSARPFPHYFLATTLLKTPLPVLLGAAGALWLAVRARRAGRADAACEVLAPAAAIGAILLAATLGGLNIGHRHVLAIEPLLALVVAGGLKLALDEGPPRRTALGGAFALAIAGGAAASLRAHPDALGYTNALAGSRPDFWLVDSNLDWGQDLDRLVAWLDARGVRRDEVALAYFGAADPRRHGLRPRPLPPGRPVTGWVAASVTLERGAYVGDPRAYGWLLALDPEATIGTSIRVYRVTVEDLRRRGIVD